MAASELIPEVKEPKLELNNYLIENKCLMKEVCYKMHCQLEKKLKKMKKNVKNDKIERKIKNIEEEITFLKKCDALNLLKFALINKTNFKDASTKQGSTTEQRALCRVTDNEEIHQKVKEFIVNYPCMAETKFALKTIQNLGAKYRKKRIKMYKERDMMESLMEKERTLLVWINNYTDVSLPDTFKAYMKYFSQSDKNIESESNSKEKATFNNIKKSKIMKLKTEKKTNIQNEENSINLESEKIPKEKITLRNIKISKGRKLKIEKKSNIQTEEEEGSNLESENISSNKRPVNNFNSKNKKKVKHSYTKEADKEENLDTENIINSKKNKKRKAETVNMPIEKEGTDEDINSTSNKSLAINPVCNSQKTKKLKKKRAINYNTEETIDNFAIKSLKTNGIKSKLKRKLSEDEDLSVSEIDEALESGYLSKSSVGFYGIVFKGQMQNEIDCNEEQYFVQNNEKILEEEEEYF